LEKFAGRLQFDKFFCLIASGGRRRPAKEKGMNNYICAACGPQFRKTDRPPQRCPICENQRQFVNWEGQQLLSAVRRGR
jgi:DNA-directed RNA polymerase subunit RPC12/RpoP